MAAMKKLCVAVFAVVLVGCGGGESVPWDDYAAGYQARIDSLAASKQCAKLQDEFDIADKNSAATKSRTGHNNAALMSYIDSAMRKAGCYK